MPKHMDVEMVVAAESILRLVCVLVPVASLVRVDLDVLEWAPAGYCDARA